MTLAEDFANSLSILFDPVTGLGSAITLGGDDLNALVRYEVDMDDTGVKAEVMDLDILRMDYEDEPEYRIEAVVNGASWYFWKLVAGDEISRRLRFVKHKRSKFSAGQQR